MDHRTQTVLAKVHEKGKKTIHYKDQPGKKLQRILFPQKVNSVVAHTGRHYSITLS
jgi:hypothetical protein